MTTQINSKIVWCNVASQYQTPDLINQNFEGAGYDNGESWNENTTGGTVNEDYLVSSVTGAPGNWGTQCLQLNKTGADNCRTRPDLGSDKPITWTRFETIFGAWDSTAGAWQLQIALGLSTALEGCWVLWLAREAGGDYKFLVYFYDNGSNAAHETYSSAISLNTMYRHEFKYDATNYLYYWHITGGSYGSETDLVSGSLSGTIQAGVRYCPYLGHNSTAAYTFTLYFDRAAVSTLGPIGP